MELERVSSRFGARSPGRRARIVHAPDSRRLEARVRRYQRRLARQRRGSRRRERTRRRLARTQRRIAQRRRDWQHQVSRSLAGGAVVVEALRTRAMTASARGTVAAPGRHVRQKAGLNRGILATGWSGLRAMLAYKAPRLVAVDPAHTSRTCAACGLSMTTENCTFLATENCTLSRGREGGQGGDAPAGGAPARGTE